MARRSLKSWCNYEAVAKEEDDPFFFPTLLSPDFGYYVMSCGNGCATLEWNYCLPFDHQESLWEAPPLITSFPPDPLCPQIFDFEHNPHDAIQGLDIEDYSANGTVIFKEMGAQNEPKQRVLYLHNSGQENGHGEAGGDDKRLTKGKSYSYGNSRMLSREQISQYFYMPITRAAKELNIGLTLLKKRCRELGIRRWPHRKLMSLQTLIKNVQEMRGGGSENEEQLGKVVNLLELEKKLMEEIPDIQLEDKTKRLRQACFKANYKKRKLVGLMDSGSTSSRSSATAEDDGMSAGFADEEDVRSLLFDDSPSCSSTI
ncbi:uncharacterized protein LOC115734721 [Rhodamnia argentea]|uniref:Uncharacterized protein LOC115734721 n=1 Tax=Rhodamnia argentea TaxID=178133 RepID=A0A8B8NHF2_9MYRT|nr:uncharacterized protein LOC115734721 [Rhodamnia argentea]